MKTPDQPAHPLTRDHTLLNAARAEITRLRAENITLRAAQKACEACDEPTAFEVRQLRAEAERTDAIYQRACEVEQELRAELAALIARVERAKELSEASNSQLSLICGELTAREIRTIRAVVGFILRNTEKSIEEVNQN